MTALHFTVPGAPVPWMRAGSRNGVRYTPARQRQYQRLVRDVAATAMLVDVCTPNGRVVVMRRPRRWPLDARYSVSLVATFGDARKRDIDNVQKTIGDALQGVAWDDDSQIDEWHVTRARGTPGLDVTIAVIQ